MPKTYTITCTKEQLSLIARACELSCRLRSGQLNNLHQLLLEIGDNEGVKYDYETIDYLLGTLKILVGLNTNESIGIRQSTDTARNLYDIYRPIYEFDAKEPSVYTYKGDQTGEYPRINISEELK